MNELIDFWEQFNTEEKPLFHEKDKNNIKKDYYKCNNFKDYIKHIKSQNFKSENKFHSGLIPIPYIGDIENAKIYILMNNPGFEILDYYAESCNKKLRDTLIDNLHQEKKLLDSEFPFIFLNPEFLWHGGGRYWEIKLKNIIEETKILFKCSYAGALSHVAKTVAVLQFVPYHSKDFLFPNGLESSKIMREFVKEELLKKAKEKKIYIICARGKNYWNLEDDGNNVFVYKGNQSHAAHISKKTLKERWEDLVKLLK